MPRTQSNSAWDTTLLNLGVPDGTGPRALHARLAQALRTAIRAGVLHPGRVLPPSRILAADLGCSRWAVNEAYQQLAAEGYIDARVGSGTRVVWRDRPDVAVPAPPAPHGRAAGTDLAPGLPDLRAFPLAQWLAALRSAAATLPHQRLGYRSPAGEPELRQVLAGYLRRVRGAAVHPDDLTVCSGVTDAVTRLCLAARERGVRAAAVEDPGWTRLRDTIAATGLRVIPVPVDEQGLRADLLDRRRDLGLAVVTPAHQFPTGVVLSPQRRRALLDWARRVDGLIIEDDYDAEFRYDRRPVGAVQGTDPRRVALAGSVSKTLSPALGLGWLATPPHWTAAVQSGLALPSILDQHAFASLVDTGGYDRYLRNARKRYRARRDVLVHALNGYLPQWTVSGVAAGLHLVVRLEPTAGVGGPDGPAIVRAAADAGLRIACARQYRVRNRSLDDALVLGYGNLADGEVTAAASKLAVAIASAGRIKRARAATWR
jgi:GntR family transcriptional regulator/MocR family aminotransferase